MMYNNVNSFYNLAQYIWLLAILASPVIFIGSIFLIARTILLVVNSTDKAETLKRGYFYLMSFFTLTLAFISLADLLRVIFGYTGDTSSYYGNYYSYASDLVARVSILIVVMPLYIFHWYNALKTTGSSAPSLTGHYNIEKKSYVYLVLFFTTLLLIGTGSALIYFVLLTILGAGTSSITTYAVPFSYTLVGLAVWLYHAKVLKDSE